MDLQQLLIFIFKYRLILKEATFTSNIDMYSCLVQAIVRVKIRTKKGNITISCWFNKDFSLLLHKFPICNNDFPSIEFFLQEKQTPK